MIHTSPHLTCPTIYATLFKDQNGKKLLRSMEKAGVLDALQKEAQLKGFIDIKIYTKEK